MKFTIIALFVGVSQAKKLYDDELTNNIRVHMSEKGQQNIRTAYVDLGKQIVTERKKASVKKIEKRLHAWLASEKY